MAPDATGANRRTRPFGRDTSSRQGIGQGNGWIAQEGVGFKEKAVAATATASDVGEHAAFERIRQAGGLRVAQKE